MLRSARAGRGRGATTTSLHTGAGVWAAFGRLQPIIDLQVAGVRHGGGRRRLFPPPTVVEENCVVKFLHTYDVHMMVGNTLKCVSPSKHRA